MKLTLLALTTVLALGSTAQAQYGVYQDDPGPSVWRRGAPRWQRNYFEPQYRTNKELCIRYGYCVDPRRPVMPPYPRGHLDPNYNGEDY